MIEEKIFRNSKNSIFLDLFTIPEYLLQLVKTLHPEMTDLKEDDIKILTVQSVFVNRPYNDLGVLVKNKLLILVEAQATWSINILIRILLYLASTYHDYIQDNKLSVYSDTKIDLPEPEFYVIYTGNKKINKDFISLREDIFKNPESKLDLIARVIHSENKKDIIGQYIIFCHVLDSQIKIYGYTKKALENAIKICQNSDVLKKYLESRKKEVNDIMFVLFDQDYNTELYAQELAKKYAKEYAQEQAILNVAETCKDLGLSIEDSIKKIAAKFNINQERAADYVNDVWENKISSDKYSDEYFKKAKEDLIEFKKYLDEYNDENEAKEI